MDIQFKIAETYGEFEDAISLFKQYAASLPIDLSFQGFADELNTIAEQYSKPKGALILAYKEGEAIGCVGIRELDGEIAELKRMFVQPKHQGQKIGQRMLNRIIEIARELQYKKIRLDTLSTMKEALHLYRIYGFYEIPPYRFNPHKETVYMEKDLSDKI